MEKSLQGIVQNVLKEVKDHKDLAPIVGALIGLYLAKDDDALEKILSGAIGVGVGTLVKGLLEDNHGK